MSLGKLKDQSSPTLIDKFSRKYELFLFADASMGFNCTGNFQLQGGLENRRSLCCEKAGKAYQEKSQSCSKTRIYQIS